LIGDRAPIARHASEKRKAKSEKRKAKSEALIQNDRFVDTRPKPHFGFRAVGQRPIQ
jgi:hypothetical protein